eukprot:1378186-Alexandrium_andersonii.AAC.1
MGGKARNGQRTVVDDSSIAWLCVGPGKWSCRKRPRDADVQSRASCRRRGAPRGQKRAGGK